MSYDAWKTTDPALEEMGDPPCKSCDGTGQITVHDESQDCGYSVVPCPRCADEPLCGEDW